MELILLVSLVTILYVGRAAGQNIHDHSDSQVGPKENLHHPGASLIRKRRFFDDEDLEDIERHLGEKIGAVCPAAKRWLDIHGDDHHHGGPRTLGHGDAIHLAIKIRRLKKAITLLCHPHTTTTRKPHRPHKPRPTTHRPPYRPPHRPSDPYPPLGGGLLPDDVAKNLQIRRHVIRPLRQWFGWPIGALASAFLLR